MTEVWGVFIAQTRTTYQVLSAGNTAGNQAGKTLASQSLLSNGAGGRQDISKINKMHGMLDGGP